MTSAGVLSKSTPARQRRWSWTSGGSPLPTTLVSIQGKDIETVDSYKYLGFHLNYKLDWTTNSDVLYRRGESCLHLFRRLRSFYDSVVASTVFYAVVCEGDGSTDRDRMENLVWRSSSVLDVPWTL